MERLASALQGLPLQLIQENNPCKPRSGSMEVNVAALFDEAGTTNNQQHGTEVHMMTHEDVLATLDLLLDQVTPSKLSAWTARHCAQQQDKTSNDQRCSVAPDLEQDVAKQLISKQQHFAASSPQLATPAVDPSVMPASCPAGTAARAAEADPVMEQPAADELAGRLPLASLDLSGQPLGLDGWQHLLRKMWQTVCLERLVVSNCGIEASDAGDLLGILLHPDYISPIWMYQLRWLDLSYNPRLMLFDEQPDPIFPYSSKPELPELLLAAEQLQGLCLQHTGMTGPQLMRLLDLLSAIMDVNNSTASGAASTMCLPCLVCLKIGPPAECQAAAATAAENADDLHTQQQQHASIGWPAAVFTQLLEKFTAVSNLLWQLQVLELWGLTQQQQHQVLTAVHQVTGAAEGTWSTSYVLPGCCRLSKLPAGQLLPLETPIPGLSWTLPPEPEPVLQAAQQAPVAAAAAAAANGGMDELWDIPEAEMAAAAAAAAARPSAAGAGLRQATAPSRQQQQHRNRPPQHQQAGAANTGGLQRTWQQQQPQWEQPRQQHRPAHVGVLRQTYPERGHHDEVHSLEPLLPRSSKQPRQQQQQQKRKRHRGIPQHQQSIDHFMRGAGAGANEVWSDGVLLDDDFVTRNPTGGHAGHEAAQSRHQHQQHTHKRKTGKGRYWHVPAAAAAHGMDRQQQDGELGGDLHSQDTGELLGSSDCELDSRHELYSEDDDEEMDEEDRNFLADDEPLENDYAATSSQEDLELGQLLANSFRPFRRLQQNGNDNSSGSEGELDGQMQQQQQRRRRSKRPFKSVFDNKHDVAAAAAAAAAAANVGDEDGFPDDLEDMQIPPLPAFEPVPLDDPACPILVDLADAKSNRWPAHKAPRNRSLGDELLPHTDTCDTEQHRRHQHTSLERRWHHQRQQQRPLEPYAASSDDAEQHEEQAQLLDDAFVAADNEDPCRGMLADAKAAVAAQKAASSSRRRSSGGGKFVPPPELQSYIQYDDELPEAPLGAKGRELWGMADGPRAARRQAAAQIKDVAAAAALQRLKELHRQRQTGTQAAAGVADCRAEPAVGRAGSGSWQWQQQQNGAERLQQQGVVRKASSRRPRFIDDAAAGAGPSDDAGYETSDDELSVDDDGGMPEPSGTGQQQHVRCDRKLHTGGNSSSERGSSSGSSERESSSGGSDTEEGEASQPSTGAAAAGSKPSGETAAETEDDLMDEEVGEGDGRATVGGSRPTYRQAILDSEPQDSQEVVVPEQQHEQQQQQQQERHRKVEPSLQHQHQQIKKVKKHQHHRKQKHQYHRKAKHGGVEVDTAAAVAAAHRKRRRQKHQQQQRNEGAQTLLFGRNAGSSASDSCHKHQQQQQQQLTPQLAEQHMQQQALLRAQQQVQQRQQAVQPPAREPRFEDYQRYKQYVETEQQLQAKVEEEARLRRQLEQLQRAAAAAVAGTAAAGSPTVAPSHADDQAAAAIASSAAAPPLVAEAVTAATTAAAQGVPPMAAKGAAGARTDTVPATAVADAAGAHVPSGNPVLQKPLPSAAGMHLGEVCVAAAAATAGDSVAGSSTLHGSVPGDAAMAHGMTRVDQEGHAGVADAGSCAPAMEACSLAGAAAAAVDVPAGAQTSNLGAAAVTEAGAIAAVASAAVAALVESHPAGEGQVAAVNADIAAPAADKAAAATQQLSIEELEEQLKAAEAERKRRERIAREYKKLTLFSWDKRGYEPNCFRELQPSESKRRNRVPQRLSPGQIEEQERVERELQRRQRQQQLQPPAVFPALSPPAAAAAVTSRPSAGKLKRGAIKINSGSKQGGSRSSSEQEDDAHRLATSMRMGNAQGKAKTSSAAKLGRSSIGSACENLSGASKTIHAVNTKRKTSSSSSSSSDASDGEDDRPLAQVLGRRMSAAAAAAATPAGKKAVPTAAAVTPAAGSTSAAAVVTAAVAKATATLPDAAETTKVAAAFTPGDMLAAPLAVDQAQETSGGDEGAAAALAPTIGRAAAAAGGVTQANQAAAAAQQPLPAAAHAAAADKAAQSAAAAAAAARLAALGSRRQRQEAVSPDTDKHARPAAVIEKVAHAGAAVAAQPDAPVGTAVAAQPDAPVGTAVAAQPDAPVGTAVAAQPDAPVGTAVAAQPDAPVGTAVAAQPDAPVGTAVAAQPDAPVGTAVAKAVSSAAFADAAACVTVAMAAAAAEPVLYAAAAPTSPGRPPVLAHAMTAATPFAPAARATLQAPSAAAAAAPCCIDTTDTDVAQTTSVADASETPQALSPAKALIGNPASALPAAATVQQADLPPVVAAQLPAAARTEQTEGTAAESCQQTPEQQCVQQQQQQQAQQQASSGWNGEQPHAVMLAAQVPADFVVPDSEEEEW